MELPVTAGLRAAGNTKDIPTTAQCRQIQPLTSQQSQLLQVSLTWNLIAQLPRKGRLGGMTPQFQPGQSEGRPSGHSQQCSRCSEEEVKHPPSPAVSQAYLSSLLHCWWPPSLTAEGLKSAQTQTGRKPQSAQIYSPPGLPPRWGQSPSAGYSALQDSDPQKDETAISSSSEDL